MQTIIAAQHGNDVSEKDSLDHAARQIERIREPIHGRPEDIRADAGIIHRSEPSAQHADDIPEHGQHRHHEHAGNHARDDQVIDGVHRHHAKRVDLFRDLHRADLRRNGRAHAPRTHHAHQHGPQLAPDGNGDDAPYRRLRPKPDELVRRLQGEHHPREQERQAHNGQGIHAQMRHLRDDMPHAGTMEKLLHGLAVQ